MTDKKKDGDGEERRKIEKMKKEEREVEER